MHTLDTFYQSKEWVGLTHIIRQERVNAEGFNVCERCGKPIIKAYDCICHHKIALTDDNVNDVSVSLNPANIVLVHHACHNRIHHKLGYKRREVYLVYGSPCSGKNTYVNQVMQRGDLLIDVEKIKQMISNEHTHVLIPALNPIVFGIRDYLYESIRLKRGYWNNAYMVGGFPLVSERERICRKYGAREIFIDTPKEVCIERLNADPDGRDIKEWTKYIEEWWRRYRPSPS